MLSGPSEVESGGCALASRLCCSAKRLTDNLLPHTKRPRKAGRFGLGNALVAPTRVFNESMYAVRIPVGVGSPISPVHSVDSNSNEISSYGPVFEDPRIDPKPPAYVVVQPKISLGETNFQRFPLSLKRSSFSARRHSARITAFAR